MCSCPCSQEPVTGSCIGSGQSNSYLFTFLSIFFFTCFLIRIWFAFLSYPVRVTCPTLPAVRKVITVIIFGEESISRNISSCSFYLLFSSRSGMVFSKVTDCGQEPRDYSLTLQSELHPGLPSRLSERFRNFERYSEKRSSNTTVWWK
jgi:hypothetical protein